LTAALWHWPWHCDAAVHANIDNLELILGSVSPQAKPLPCHDHGACGIQWNSRYASIYLHECHHSTRIMAMVAWLSVSPLLNSVVARRPPLLSPSSS
jgi:hypothetical protein